MPMRTVREACSCGASIDLPFTDQGRAELREWRHMHHHVTPRLRGQDEQGEQDGQQPEPGGGREVLPATGHMQPPAFGFAEEVLASRIPGGDTLTTA